MDPQQDRKDRERQAELQARADAMKAKLARMGEFMAAMDEKVGGHQHRRVFFLPVKHVDRGSLHAPMCFANAPTLLDAIAVFAGPSYG